MTLSIAILLLAGINHFIGRSWYYPPTVFCVIWGIVLMLIASLGTIYYPVAQQIQVFYFLGALAFSIGGFFSVPFMERKKRGNNSVLPMDGETRRVVMRSKKLIICLVLFLIVMLPIYITHLEELAKTAPGPNFFYAVRMAQLNRTMNEQIPIIENLSTLSMIIALIAWRQMIKFRIGISYALIAALVAICYNALTGGRFGVAFIVICISGMTLLKLKRGDWKILLTIGSSFVAVMGAIAIFLNKFGANTSLGFAGNIYPVLIGFITYAISGTIAFGHVVSHPGSVPAHWDMWVFFKHIANMLGMNFKLFNSVSEPYTYVGPGISTNVYTIYFSYWPQYGIAGTLYIMTILGFFTSIIYWLARRGYMLAIPFYGVVLFAVLLSPYSEYFFMPLGFYIRILITILAFDILVKSHFVLKKSTTISKAPS